MFSTLHSGQMIWVLVLAGVSSLCSRARHFTLGVNGYWFPVLIVREPASEEEKQMLIGTHSKARIPRDAWSSKTARGTLQEEIHFKSTEWCWVCMEGIFFLINSIIS